MPPVRPLVPQQQTFRATPLTSGVDPKEKSAVSEEAEYWPLNAAREASQDRGQSWPPRPRVPAVRSKPNTEIRPPVPHLKLALSSASFRLAIHKSPWNEARVGRGACGQNHRSRDQPFTHTICFSVCSTSTRSLCAAIGYTTDRFPQPSRLTGVELQTVGVVAGGAGSETPAPYRRTTTGG